MDNSANASTGTPGKLPVKSTRRKSNKTVVRKLPGYKIPASTVIQCKALLRIGIPHRDIAAKLMIGVSTVQKVSDDVVTFKGATAEEVSATEEMFAATSMQGQQIAAEIITGKLLTDDSIKIDKAAFAMTQLAICREKAQGKQQKQSSQVNIVIQIANQRAEITASIKGNFDEAIIPVDNFPPAEDKLHG